MRSIFPLDIQALGIPPVQKDATNQWIHFANKKGNFYQSSSGYQTVTKNLAAYLRQNGFKGVGILLSSQNPTRITAGYSALSEIFLEESPDQQLLLGMANVISASLASLPITINPEKEKIIREEIKLYERSGCRRTHIGDFQNINQRDPETTIIIHKILNEKLDEEWSDNSFFRSKRYDFLTCLFLFLADFGMIRNSHFFNQEEEIYREALKEDLKLKLRLTEILIKKFLSDAISLAFPAVRGASPSYKKLCRFILSSEYVYPEVNYGKLLSAAERYRAELEKLQKINALD